VSNNCHFFPLTATIFDKQMTSTFSRPKIERDLNRWLKTASKITSKTSKKGLQKVQLTSSLTSKMTSIFDCQFQAGMAGCTMLAHLFNKIYSFRNSPASTLLFKCSQTSDYKLTDVIGMAHSLTLNFITSKNSTL